MDTASQMSGMTKDVTYDGPDLKPSFRDTLNQACDLLCSIDNFLTVDLAVILFLLYPENKP